MTRRFTDMLGREIELTHPPKCIISLVPSQTELLHDLGLEEEVVGITKFCVHPEQWFRTKQRIGGTKKLDIEKIKALEPDVIIANKEENEKAQVEELAAQFPVWTSDISNVGEALEMIRAVGKLVDKEAEAEGLARQISNGFTTLQKANHHKRTAYFIWYKPWMSVGGDTFISDVIRRVGWQNVLADTTRYPAVDLQALKAKAPELILLSSEPFPFKKKHVEELRDIFPAADIKLVDGEMFSWYGSRMLKAVEYFPGIL